MTGLVKTGALALAIVVAGAVQLSLVSSAGEEFSLQRQWWWQLPLMISVLYGGWLLIEASARDHGEADHVAGRWLRLLLSCLPATLLTVMGLYAWEVLVTGFDVPVVLLPAPSMIWHAVAANTGVLWNDFVQTVLRSVIPGYVIGCSTGISVAALAWRYPKMGHGLLSLGNFMSVLPIVGVAPIMVMWFGFDWQSKAAVAALMTFFPMLVNSLSGFRAAGRQERDLMRTYAASRATFFFKLVLPAAMPFIFNGLKVSSTLALIGAIVAEFFGTPIVGMGFRISSEVGRMGLDMVWATIVVSAFVGTASYGILLALERMVTFWDASWR